MKNIFIAVAIILSVSARTLRGADTKSEQPADATWIFVDLNNRSGEYDMLKRAAGSEHVARFHSVEQLRDYMKKHPQSRPTHFVLSGHAFGDLYVPPQVGSEIDPRSLETVMTKEQRASVEDFYALGCFTGVEAVSKEWIHVFPNENLFITGFDGRGPSFDESNNFIQRVSAARAEMRRTNSRSLDDFNARGVFGDTNGVAEVVKKNPDGGPPTMDRTVSPDVTRRTREAPVTHDRPIGDETEKECFDHLKKITDNGPATFDAWCNPHISDRDFNVTDPLNESVEKKIRGILYEEILKMSDCPASFFSQKKVQTFFGTRFDSMTQTQVQKVKTKGDLSEVSLPVIYMVHSRDIAKNVVTCLGPTLKALQSQFNSCSISGVDASQRIEVAQTLADLIASEENKNVNPYPLFVRLYKQLKPPALAPTHRKNSAAGFLATVGETFRELDARYYPVESWDFPPSSKVCRAMQPQNNVAPQIRGCSEVAIPAYAGFVVTDSGGSLGISQKQNPSAVE